jgi:hypothetical protein
MLEIGGEVDVQIRESKDALGVHGMDSRWRIVYRVTLLQRKVRYI